MKTGRRQDPDGLRRLPRERDLALGRMRKRPSMLSEFHGKHYNHRETDRDSAHGRSFHRYDLHDAGPGFKGPKRDRYGPGYFKSDSADTRSFLASPYARTLPPQYNSTFGMQDDNAMPLEYNNSHEEDAPSKRPRLLGDEQLDTPSSADSVSSGPIPFEGQITQDSTPSLPTSPPPGPGLSAYLEDIESDEGDLLMVDEEEKPPGGSLPDTAPPTPPTTQMGASSGQPSKEQLLQKMDTVDRDIAATEGQISALQKRQAEFEGSIHSTPSTSTPSPLYPSPLPPSPSLSDEEGAEEEGVSSPPTPLDKKRGSPKRSLQDSVYSENKLKARSAQAALHCLYPLLPSSAQSTAPLYNQPWEAPGYFNIIERHLLFRSSLIQLMQKQRLKKHEKDLALCKEYDDYMTDWKKRLEKAESSTKKKTRDQKNRELFERTFPELKARREQHERLMRVDQRGYAIIRSDLELSQLMCELYEQEEAPARSRRTHAVIPAMVAGGAEEGLAFHSTNGLIQDPMAVYRAAKLTNVWADEEKKIFREKYALYPKNFEAISSFLPCKTTADCVRHYYLSKKNEKFKQLARKATFKRRKFYKPGELAGLSHVQSRLSIDGEKAKMRSPLLSDTASLQATPTAAMPTMPGQDEGGREEPMSPKPSRYGDWTEEDISNMRIGLRKWGRAWGKIYSELGGRKTATQCKQFFDDFCSDEALGLGRALTERSSIKNAEKAQRKALSRKPALTPMPAAKRRPAKSKAQVEQENEQERAGEGRDAESEPMESASNSESGSADEESGSESTITDSSPEDNAALPTGHAQSSAHRSWKSHASSLSPSRSSQASEKGALDLFISAAEALSNIVPPEVALHDHNYALAPLSSVDIQGSSGLSLIAAAAAVVSPTLSRSAGSGKFPAVSPVRAPRGRPPNTQRRGSSGSTCKLSPTLLSPAGSSIYVPLTDTTKSSFRSRTRSAPSDRPRLQLARAGPSNLRYSISSKSGSPRPILPPASYTRLKDSPAGPAGTTASGGAGGTPSLKSMIASRPQQTNSSNAAFETLVNVAVAASPAELPKTTSGPPTATLSISFQNSSSSAPVTTGTQLSDGTYSIDMSHAFNILALASLAQNPGSSSACSSPQPLLLTQGVGSSSLLGTIVSQSTAHHEGARGGGGGGRSSTPGTVNVLIGHLTSGSASPSPGSTATPSESSVSAKSSPVSHTELPRPRLKSSPQVGQPPPVSPTPYPSSPAPSMTSSSDDLSNLNLLSSLVAVVAGSQAPPPTPPSHTHTSSSTRTDTLVGYSYAKTTTTNSPIASVTSNLHPRSSAFKATNLPAALTKNANSLEKTASLDKKELTSRTKPHEKVSSLSSLVNSEHLRSSSRSPVANSSPLDNLARSVVRSSSLAHTHSAHSTTNTSQHTHSPLPSYPSPAPSISQQSTLLLYTRSLSLPNPSGTEVSSEEEDHLESATRGISELSKLLGTDSGTESVSSGSDSSTATTPAFRNPWDQGAGAIPPPPVRTPRAPRGGSPSSVFSSKSELGNDSSKPYLSGLLESHTSHLAAHSTASQKNSNNNNDVDMTHRVSR